MLPRPAPKGSPSGKVPRTPPHPEGPRDSLGGSLRGGLGNGEIGDENNPLLAAIGFNLRSKYNQIAEKVQRWLQTILLILSTDIASAQRKIQDFKYQTLKLAF